MPEAVKVYGTSSVPKKRRITSVFAPAMVGRPQV
jgi:hypothetical protein